MRRSKRHNSARIPICINPCTFYRCFHGTVDVLRGAVDVLLERSTKIWNPIRKKSYVLQSYTFFIRQLHLQLRHGTPPCSPIDWNLTGSLTEASSQVRFLHLVRGVGHVVVHPVVQFGGGVHDGIQAGFCDSEPTGLGTGQGLVRQPTTEPRVLQVLEIVHATVVM